MEYCASLAWVAILNTLPLRPNVYSWIFLRILSAATRSPVSLYNTANSVCIPVTVGPCLDVSPRVSPGTSLRTRLATSSPPHHVTPEDIDVNTEHLVAYRITRHELVRKSGPQLVILY